MRHSIVTKLETKEKSKKGAGMDDLYECRQCKEENRTYMLPATAFGAEDATQMYVLAVLTVISRRRIWRLVLAKDATSNKADISLPRWTYKTKCREKQTSFSVPHARAKNNAY